MTSPLLVSIVVAILSATIESVNGDGLYVSNGTDILYIDPSNPLSTPTSVYNEPYGRIVGLAYHATSGFIFWSDVSIGTRGIYRGTPDAAGGISGTKRKIVDSDILEVNGLSVDWISNNLYWTDGRKRTIEVLKLDGTYTTRRILISTGLTIPRGIYADPVNKYLFWNDQGTKQIERSRLDGSDRKTIVTNTNFPNQMAVSNRVLYWVNSDQKTFESCSLDGTNRKSTSVSAQTSGQHIFGLAINGNTAYISSWINGNVIQINTDGSSPTVFKYSLGTDAMFSAIFFSSNNQPTAQNPCTLGCVQLCFPITDSTARCSCSSFGGYYLSSATTCTRITASSSNNILLYALADEGYVGFYPNPTLTSTSNTERYLVGRSLRPVAVAYDPVQQFVYWSDVAERTIHRCKLDGTEPEVFMQTSDGIGIVDGMVIDYTRRQLYYTNMGSMTINNNQYTWHKVEAVGLDSLPIKVRTIVGTAEKPRALALDQANGYLYYTDWGNKGMIVRVQLDGSNSTIIRSGLDNPNGITIQNGKIFIVDSHYKSRDPNNPNYPNKNTPASLYSMNLDGSNFYIVSSPGLDLKIPFGLGSDNSGNLYISDWGNNKTTVVSSIGASPSVILNNSPYVMSLFFSPVTQTAGSNPCSGSVCGDICLTQGTSTPKCACNSYKGNVLNGASCTAPTQFLLVADMNSIKLVGLDTSDQSVYSLIQGTPFISNFAGMTYDSTTQTIYYNDISSKTINAYFMSNQTTVEFYRVNQVIDGMVFEPSGKKLYWTDFTNGRICFLDTTSSSTNRLHSVLQSNLDRPRAIKIYNREVYWTEWGQAPRVAKSSLTPYSPVTTLVSSSDNLIWPNGIFFDSNSDLYIGDGAVDSTQKIIKCNFLNGKSCVNVMNSTVGQHVYDLWVSSSGTVYYTDWSSGSVSAFSHSSSFPVVQGLMRPTQMAFVLTSSTTPPSSTCPSLNQCQSSVCLPLLGASTYGCDCSITPGAVLSFDKIKCIDTTQSSNKCTTNTSVTYNYGSKYQPKNPCTSCQCWTSQQEVDLSYPGFICERKDCPALDCPAGSTVRTPDGQCCPVCDCGLQITDCPTSLSLTLPSTQDFAVFEYLPSIRDCTGKSRTITQTKTPVGDVYRWQVGAGTQQVPVTYTVLAGTDSNPCKFNINLIDVTPPVIICPGTVKILTFDDTAKVVTWSPPQVTENVGYTAPVATPAWGSDFSVGLTTVKYVVTDYAGLSAACTFIVNVTKLTPPSDGGGSCVIPRVQNGFMTCNMVFNCTASCNPGYNLKSGSVISTRCVNGAWYPIVSPNFERQTCYKPANKSVTGYINVTSPTECLPGINLQYTVDFLQDTIRRNGYLGRSSFPLKISVKGFGCSQNIRKRRATNDIINKIAVTGQYSCFDDSTLNDMKADIKTILDGIKSDLQRGFFNLPFRSSNGISTAVDPTVTDITWSDDCPDGQFNDSSTCCAYCPAGTFQSDPNTCSDCINGTYNDQEGAFQCKSCPSQCTSPAHSVIAQQCTAVPGVSPVVDDGLSQTNKLIIGIVVGVGGFLLLLIIIIIVYCCCCRRRNKNNQPSNGFDSHRNPVYKDKEGQDNIGIYDNIDEAGKSSSDYSTLQKPSPGDDQPKYESLRPPSPDHQPDTNHS